MNKIAKKAIIKGSLPLFSTHGYTNTTIRMLANDLNLNISAINYYFGSKDVLYQEVLKYITNIIWLEIKPFFSVEHSEVLKSDKAKAKENILRFVYAVQTISEKECMQDKILICIKEQIAPSAHYEILYKNLIKKTISFISEQLQILNPKANRPYLLLTAQSFIVSALVTKTQKHILSKFDYISTILNNQHNIFISAFIDTIETRDDFLPHIATLQNS